MLIIGLTGGIASGKSTVARHFAAHGVPVIDADEIARELVEPGQPALDEIAAAFGSEFIRDDGTLDRARMKSHVFHDAAARKRLEDILHPRIEAEMRHRSRALQVPYCVFVIPLLFEAGQQHLVDRVLVVDLPPAVQRDRLRARDEMPSAQIDAILGAQIGRDSRLEQADDIIRNDGDLTQLQQQVDALHRKYLELARSQPPAV